MGDMDLADLWQRVVLLVASFPRSDLLVATLVAVAAGMAASTVLRRPVVLGRLLRAGSTVALAGILVLVVLQLSRFDSRFDIAVPQLGLPEQTVEGGETRIPLAPDGHYWVRAEINGSPAAFMIDTGATLTTLNEDTASAAGLQERVGGVPLMIETANGVITAKTATVDELRFGNIEARGLDVAIAPNIGRTNVLGMNLLSRLHSWRVEQGTMILSPAGGRQTAPAD